MPETLCLDFDGVVHFYRKGWTSAAIIDDEPVPGVLEKIIEYMEYFDVCIFSSRSSSIEGIQAMKLWLFDRFKEYFYEKRTGISYIEENCVLTDEDVNSAERIMSHISFPTVKPPAKISIDDRAITFTGTFPSVEELKAFVPWNYGKTKR